MNNYTLKVDKVGTDEVFPYPIKLDYDNNYIYLTPLWIPETSNVLISKNKNPETGERSPINLQEANENNRLYIALEYATPKKIYKYKRYMRNPPSSYANLIKYSSKGGKFRTNWSLIGNINGPIVLNHTYQFKIPKDAILYHTYLWLTNFKQVDILTSFNFFRGTYRYGNHNDYKRTGIYSNTAKIYYSL